MTEFSFENENQPVCSSVSSCLTLNVSSIFTSSFSSLINAIFIIVCHVDISFFTMSFSAHLDTDIQSYRHLIFRPLIHAHTIPNNIIFAEFADYN